MTPTYRPLADWHLVEMIAPCEQTEGGVFLPETWSYNDTTARVLASGPGVGRADGGCSVQWAQPGNVVLAPREHLWAITETESFVQDRNLYGFLDGDEIVPLNDWVLIEPDRAKTEHTCGLSIPNKYRRRGHFGTVRGIGPGALRLTGPLRGVREPVSKLLGGVELSAGDRVWWEDKMKAIAVGRHELAGLLLRAGSLMMVEAIDCEAGNSVVWPEGAAC